MPSKYEQLKGLSQSALRRERMLVLRAIWPFSKACRICNLELQFGSELAKLALVHTWEL